MSEFELSTLAVLALLLLGVGAYSYWQIYRAQKIQEAQKWRQRQEEAEEERAHKSRYPSYDPAYVEAQEPLPETWPPTPESVHTDDALTRPQGQELDEVLTASPVAQPQDPMPTVIPMAMSHADTASSDDVPSFLKKQTESASTETTLEKAIHVDELNISTAKKVDEPVDVAPFDQASNDVVAETSAEQTASAMYEPMADEIQDASQSLSERSSEIKPLDTEIGQVTTVHTVTMVDPIAAETTTNESAVEVLPTVNQPIEAAAPTIVAVQETVAPKIVAPSSIVSVAPVSVGIPASSAMPIPPVSARSDSSEIEFDVLDAEEKARIEQRVTAQELKRRAAWDVFAPFARFEHWLHTAYPHGVDPIRAIDAEIEISLSQPKTSADIERALYDLRLDTPLPLRLYGARAGQISLDSGAKKVWQDLEPGAPYCALKLTLQLANRSHCAKEDVLQHWFALSESLRKRLSGHIETLPDVHELAEYARFLHALARRVGQPIILQLHKDNGLWPAYEVHQQLTACGAVLNDRGIYIARNERNTPVYTVVNDVNNPRAQDFFRDQMAVMYVHTLSFCVELARIELHAQDAAGLALAPIQRLLDDMKMVAEALDAQWQNNLGETLDVDELEKIAHEQTRIFAQQLTELGLPVGALMTKRLLLG